MLIALSQVKDFLGLVTPKLPADFFSLLGVLARHLDTLNLAALLVGMCSLALVLLWPKAYAMPHTRASGLAQLRRLVAHLPGTLVALVLATLATVALSLPVETIGSRFGSIPQSLPSLVWPDFSWTGVKQLIIPTLTIALLGAIESLLCARVADNLTDLPRHDPNQELMAQGVANLVTPFFGGIPATGTVARTVTNVRAGATSPVAGVVHALTVLGVMLLAAPLAQHVPLAALAGILMFVAWNMGEWREFSRLRHFSLHYRTILVGTFVLTVVFDLTVAVEVGLVLACAFFIVRMGGLFSVQVLPATPGDKLPDGIQVLELFGALFFGAVGKVEALPAQLPAGTRLVVLDMHRLISLDTSGLDALAQLHRTLRRQGTAMALASVNAQPLSLLQRSGFAAELGSAGIVPTWQDAAREAPPKDT